ncbi:tetraspanin-9-like [Centropristis striata]|uniref:tetraspanin-9-like n=1 Tax=Centropristis striata TaxID=184440 RepID=UPI0027DF5FDC|nr:tetraspanin-9-like [Centropristis striata]
MGKINGCIKCLFVFFNVLFAILGCGLVYGAVKASVVSGQLSAVGGPSLGWTTWVFAIGVLSISCLGIYAGISEKGIALKIFAGLMGVGMIIMLIYGIIIVVFRNQIKSAFDSSAAEVSKPNMEEESFRQMLEGFQHSSHCCGVTSATDWGDVIPDSCECNGFGCKSKPKGVTGPEKIYSQTCGDQIFFFFDIIFKIAMGFFFAFAVIALLGLLISIFMIHQIKRQDGGGSSIAMKGY